MTAIAGRRLLVLTVLALWFGFLEVRGLYFPDEGRYAEIPREMLSTGDWVTPRLNGIPYFEKPPLQYWVTAAIFAVAGEDEWTTRLWPALAGFLAVVAVFLTVRRLFSRRAAWLAAATMGTCWGYFLASQFVTLDMSLSALMTGALCAFLVAQDARTVAATRRNLMIAAWAFCALAVLTKGVVGVALPILAVIAYVALTRDTTILRRLHPAAGLATFAVIAVPWFVMAEVRNPGFADFFFVREHLMRYLRPEHRRPGPWWYFVPVAIAFLLPWLPAMVDAAWRTRASARRGPPPDGIDAIRFAWCSAAAIVVFFSLSSSKLPAYIMPAIGAVAIATAPPLARRFDPSVRATALTLVACGMLAAMLVIPAAEFVKVPMVRDEIVSGRPWIFAGAALFIAGGLATIWLLRQGMRMRALAVVAVTSMAGCQLGAMLAAHADAYFSSERLIERVTGGEGVRPFRPDLPFYSVDTFDHTVPFYLGRTVTIVREQGELAWGLGRAPANYIAQISDFETRWRGDDDAYAIMDQGTYKWLRGLGWPMRLVDTDGRRVIVRRR